MAKIKTIPIIGKKVKMCSPVTGKVAAPTKAADRPKFPVCDIDIPPYEIVHNF
ncbi:hypothetical protein [Lacticaseibacillus camelliae]|uniref:hypothetical protein n=1 Tax=Lacticaseibacillus camelliae TaxID=381742 RepID=UPI001F214E9D|nr:hypothetical protein [Lacticaseibacillus camelliae]